MTVPSENAGLVETFHGSPDGVFGATLFAGALIDLTIAMSALEQPLVGTIGVGLTEFLNEAYDRHTTDSLAAVSMHVAPMGQATATVAEFADRAVARAHAVINLAPSRQRQFTASFTDPHAAEVLGHSPDGEVTATLSMGRIHRLDIGDRLLFNARPAPLATAVISAIHDAHVNNSWEEQHFIQNLSAEQLDQETEELHDRITALEGEQR